jgi:hypothetical protein
MGKRHRRKFTDEFKAETVKLIRESGRREILSQERDQTRPVSVVGSSTPSTDSALEFPALALCDVNPR